MLKDSLSCCKLENFGPLPKAEGTSADCPPSVQSQPPPSPQSAGLGRHKPARRQDGIDGIRSVSLDRSVWRRVDVISGAPFAHHKRRDAEIMPASAMAAVASATPSSDMSGPMTRIFTRSAPHRTGQSFGPSGVCPTVRPTRQKAR